MAEEEERIRQEHEARAILDRQAVEIQETKAQQAEQSE
jgi:hypothetical protein